MMSRREDTDTKASIAAVQARQPAEHCVDPLPLRDQRVECKTCEKRECGNQNAIEHDDGRAHAQSRQYPDQ